MAVEAEPSPRSTEGTQETKLAIAVEDEIFRLSPHYVLGLIMLRAPTTGLACETSRSSKTLAEAEERIRKEYSDAAAFIASPRIAAWREAYRRAGVNPKRFPCASEALGSRVIKGKDLPRLGAIVDVCNATSLDTGLPVAACDLNGVASGALFVRRATGEEYYTPLGRPERQEQVGRGEIIYVDGESKAHSRRWNWKQSHDVRITRHSCNILITVESVIPGSSDIVSRTCEEIRQAEVLSQFPILRTHLLSADCPETTFDDIAIVAEDE